MAGHAAAGFGNLACRLMGHQLRRLAVGTTIPLSSAVANEKRVSILTWYSAYLSSFFSMCLSLTSTRVSVTVSLSSVF